MVTGHIDFLDRLFLLHVISFEVTGCKLNVQCMPITACHSRLYINHDTLNKTHIPLLMIIYAILHSSIQWGSNTNTLNIRTNSVLLQSVETVMLLGLTIN